MTKRLLMQYVLVLGGFSFGLIFAAIAAVSIASQITWSQYNPLYIFLVWIRQYYVGIFGVLFFAGWCLITYRYISRPLRYLDEVLDAATQLAEPTHKPIVLTRAMKTVQDELNLVREQAIRNSRAARDAEQRKNDLIVYLAHDLKTPLTSVIGYLTLLSDEPQLSPDLRSKYTGIALDKAQRLENLVNEFFEITRFNLSTLSLETETVNLTRMVEQIADEFKPVLDEKELSWNMNLKPNVSIVCDPLKMERVFDNLIRNAVNYSREGSEIRMSLEELPDGVRLELQNSGKTIPAEKLERIFEQFFRMDSARTSSTGGAGLGLAIAKEIVEAHGGTISAKSENESITFILTLPQGSSENRMIYQIKT
jgi:two-component system, OmpR family, sensor histidine kinase VanS